MRMTCVVALLAALMPGLSPAQDRGAAFVRLLQMVPQSIVLQPDGSSDIWFGDLAAARPLVAAAPGLDPRMTRDLATYDRAGSMNLGNAVMAGGERWPQLVGFAPADVAQALEIAQPPGQVQLLALVPGALATVPAGLEAAGYVPDGGRGAAAWARGGDDYAVDFAAVDPADPFGYRLGKASRVVIADELVIQGAGWPEVDAILGDGPRITDLESVRAVILALDDPALGPGALIRATLYPVALPLAVERLPLTLEMTPEEAAALAAAELGAPSDPAARAQALAWPAGAALFADLGTPGGPGQAVLAITFPDAALAEAAAATVATAWNTVPSQERGESYGASLGPLRLAVTGKGPFVLLMIADDPGQTREGRLRNTAMDRLMAGLMARDLVFLPRP